MTVVARNVAFPHVQTLTCIVMISGMRVSHAWVDSVGHIWQHLQTFQPSQPHGDAAGNLAEEARSELDSSQRCGLLQRHTGQERKTRTSYNLVFTFQKRLFSV